LSEDAVRSRSQLCYYISVAAELFPPKSRTVQDSRKILSGGVVFAHAGNYVNPRFQEHIAQPTYANREQMDTRDQNLAAKRAEVEALAYVTELGDIKSYDDKPHEGLDSHL